MRNHGPEVWPPTRSQTCTCTTFWRKASGTEGASLPPARCLPSPALALWESINPALRNKISLCGHSTRIGCAKMHLGLKVRRVQTYPSPDRGLGSLVALRPYLPWKRVLFWRPIPISEFGKGRLGAHRGAKGEPQTIQRSQQAEHTPGAHKSQGTTSQIRLIQLSKWAG